MRILHKFHIFKCIKILDLVMRLAMYKCTRFEGLHCFVDVVGSSNFRFLSTLTSMGFRFYESILE